MRPVKRRFWIGWTRIMKKPENRLLRILEIVGNVVTIVSVLAIVEIIRNWV
uniref:Uncharacterized protein n=1 Tax=uncultured bacterium contig00023 TaxID=1181512 RepID=A0A806JZH2_9BACT|nr:hypothetical protein [uncultured bacterium contig00023]